MALLINQNRLESTLENMTWTFMVPVKKLGIDPILFGILLDFEYVI